jgi:hypothetical protein
MPLDYYPFDTQNLLPLVWEEQLPTNVTGQNTLYYICRARMLSGLFNWLTGSPRAYLLTSDYTFDATHETLADLPSVTRLSNALISSRSVNAHGWCCSIGVEFEDVQPAVSELPASAVVFVEGNSETDKLIACFNSVVELPFTPDGRSWFFYPNASEAGNVTGSGGWFTP